MFPVLFKWKALTLYSFGLFFALGVLASYALFRLLARSKDLPVETLSNLYIGVLAVSILGARLTYVASASSYYVANPIEVFFLWEGGLIFYGGFAVGLAFLIAVCRARKLPFWRVADCFVASVAVAQVFGRVGCFLNGCCYGKPFSGFWAVRFPFLVEPVHPTQLYEAGVALALLAAVIWILGTRARPGSATLSYFALYALGRFVIEFWRGDHPAPFFGFLTLAQLSSVALFIIAAGVSLILQRRHARPPQ